MCTYITQNILKKQTFNTFFEFIQLQKYVHFVKNLIFHQLHHAFESGKIMDSNVWSHYCNFCVVAIFTHQFFEVN